MRIRTYTNDKSRAKDKLVISTGKHASKQTIHPSKLRKTLEANVSNLATTSSSIALDSSESSPKSCDTSEDSSWEDEAAPSTNMKQNPTVSQGGLLQAQAIDL